MVTFAADDAQRDAIACWADLLSLQRLDVQVTIKKLGPVRFGLDFQLGADVTQACVVTLEPVPESVSESFSALFSPEVAEDDPDMVLDPFAVDEDLPEAMNDGVIDIGELVAQHLSLALEPYPRAPGVEFSGFDDDGQPPAAEEESEAGGAPPPGPFGALAGLKRRH